MKDLLLAAVSIGFVLSLIFRKKSSEQVKNPEPELNFAPAGHAVAMSLLKNSDSSEEESDLNVLEKIGYFIGAANDGQSNVSYAATPLQDVDPEGLA